MMEQHKRFLQEITCANESQMVDLFCKLADIDSVKALIQVYDRVEESFRLYIVTTDEDVVAHVCEYNVRIERLGEVHEKLLTRS